MYIFPFLSRISLPETFHAIMKKTTSEVRWRKANITEADFLGWQRKYLNDPFIFLKGPRQKFELTGLLNCNNLVCPGCDCLPLTLIYFIYLIHLKSSPSIVSQGSDNYSEMIFKL